MYQVTTADGRVALSPDVLLMHDARWPSSEDGGYTAVFRRHQPDALLEGSGTLVLPGARPIVVDPEKLAEYPPAPVGNFLPEEVVRRTTRWFAVVDSRGRVAWQFKEFPYPEWIGTHLLVMVSQSTPSNYLAFLRSEQIPYLVVGEQQVNLRQALATLRTLLGVSTVVATCGAQLSGVLLREGLISQVEIEILPMLAGGNHTPIMFSSPDLTPTQAPTAMHLLNTTVYDDGRILLSYAIEG